MATAPATLPPIAPDYRALLEGVVADAPLVDAVANETVERGLRNVFLVGSGGSLASLYQLQFLLDSGASSFPAFLNSSAEFNVRRPASMGPGSLVIAASHRGETPETVEAARIAREAGARVVAVTRDATSPLAALAHHALTYDRNEIVIDAKLIQLAMLGSRLIELTERRARDDGLARAFSAVPAAIVDAMKGREEASAAIARQLRDEPVTYVVAAGPSYGTAYSFAMCTLMEAQWMHAAAYNAAELFHGAFEVIEPGVAVIVLLDESAARPLAERALAFVQRYSDKVAVVDSRDLALPGIEAGQRAVMTPIALGSVMYRLTAHYAAVRGRGLPDRRYMFKVPY